MAVKVTTNPRRTPIEGVKNMVLWWIFCTKTEEAPGEWELRTSQFTCLKKLRMTNDMRFGGWGNYERIRRKETSLSIFCRWEDDIKNNLLNYKMKNWGLIPNTAIIYFFLTPSRSSLWVHLSNGYRELLSFSWNDRGMKLTAEDNNAWSYIPFLQISPYCGA